MPSSTRSGKISSSDPIKGYSHKGFFFGWCAIIAVAIMAFGLLTLPLGHSRADLDAAQLSRVAVPTAG